MTQIVFNTLCACGIGFMLAGALGGSLLIASIGALLTISCGLASVLFNV
jgi:hypothetical protein